MEMIRQNEGVIYKVASFYADGREHPIGDLYQEIVLNLWKSFSAFRGESKYSTWIYRISLNTCISFYRRNKRSIEYIDISVDIPETIDNNEQIKELYALINRLGKIERALVLLYLDDKSYKEIAEITGLTVTNVATKLSRIKEKLKEMSSK
ncbi:MAG: sigma-70 family RNA polymerase sigma factor [Dysgonomonas sp.]